MAELKFQAQCGCGFKTTSAQEAIKHSDNKGHQLEIRGEVKPPKK